MGWERTPSNRELGGRARAAAERDGRGRLATGGGMSAGRRVGWARGARRRRAPSSLPDSPGNFGASPRWGVRAGPGGRSDAPSGLRAEDEVAAGRAWPGELLGSTQGKLVRTCLRLEDAWSQGRIALGISLAIP